MRLELTHKKSSYNSSHSTKSEEPVQRLRFDNDNTAGFDLFSGYKVLTPTMYRSRIAAARQAVSMDCYYSYQDEDDQNSRTKSQLLGKYSKIYMQQNYLLKTFFSSYIV